MMDMCLSISCPLYVVFSSCGNCSCYAKNVFEYEYIGFAALLNGILAGLFRNFGLYVSALLLSRLVSYS